MHKTAIAIITSGAFALAACDERPTDREISAGAVGAAITSITAAVLDADPEWVIVSALAGAAAGVLVARNRASNECAYSRGDGTYAVGSCPS